MVLSSLLLNLLDTVHIPPLKWISKFCKIPSNSGNILLVSLLGGYPVGAKIVSESYERGAINKIDAMRLIGFCNNAGPAFIFGVIGQAFSSFSVTLILWLIHISSAIITGFLLPQKDITRFQFHQTDKRPAGPTIQQCVSTMGVICAWALLFRIVIAYTEKLLPEHIPNQYFVIIAGFLELSNGCILLNLIEDTALRFLIASCLISLGGCCVTMQTASIARKIGLSYYFPGKITQTTISILLSLIAQIFLFSTSLSPCLCVCIGLAGISVLFLTIRILHHQNNSRFCSNYAV